MALPWVVRPRPASGSRRTPAGGSGLQGGPWHPAQLFDQEKPGRASLIHGQRGKPAPSGARSLPRGGGAAPLPELAPASQVGGQGSGRSAPCLARPRLPHAVFLPLLAFWLIPRRKGEGQTRRPGTGWHAGTTRSTRRRPEARVLRRWAPLSRPHAASACPPRMLPSCSVAGISSSSPSPICTARLIVPKADRPHTSQSQARRGTTFRIKQEANALCGRAPAEHRPSTPRHVAGRSVETSPALHPAPDPPGLPGSSPHRGVGARVLPAAEAGATGLGVHVDMAPETMREVGPLPGEAFAAPSLLSPRQRGRAWPQGLLGPQNGAVSKVRPSSKHPVKTRWGTGPGWGLPGTAPRPACAPPGLYHVAGGQPGFQSPVSGRDKHRSHHVALRKLCCSLKLGRLGQARPPRGPDSPGPPVRQAGHLAATHSLPLPCPALCPQPQPQEPCGGWPWAFTSERQGGTQAGGGCPHETQGECQIQAAEKSDSRAVCVGGVSAGAPWWTPCPCPAWTH